jgi:hypothetical protein
MLNSKFQQCIKCIYRLIQNKMRHTMIKVKVYLKENWGSPFIVGFMLLLIGAAVSLSISLPSLANKFALCAFYTLVGGVVLQLICILKYPRNNEGELT